jgi:hypothetical protein
MVTVKVAVWPVVFVRLMRYEPAFRPVSMFADTVLFVNDTSVRIVLSNATVGAARQD